MLFSISTQAIVFLPFALGIAISYTILRATDMTLEGSFVLGAVIFARLVSLGVSPYLGVIAALIGGMLAGGLVCLIQRGGKVDSLLAGILATFILASLNLIVMGRPNISLLNETTLFSQAFALHEMMGWLYVLLYSVFFLGLTYVFLRSNAGLTLRGLGDNPHLLKRLGKSVEGYRFLGFAFTNMLAAAGGCLTAQVVGYADIGMGFGMTLTGIGAIILGQQLLRLIMKKAVMRIGLEFSACLLGVTLYFIAINSLLKMEVDPTYLKMLLGLILIIFLRAAVRPNKGNAL